MAKISRLQLTAGTTEENNQFVGLAGELTYDTENKEIRIHDNTTVGGFVVAKAATTLQGYHINDAYTKSATNELLDTKVDKLEGYSLISEQDLTQISSNTAAIEVINGEGVGSIKKIVADQIASVINSAPEDYDTLKEIADYIASDKTNAATMISNISSNTTAIGANTSSIADIENGITELTSSVSSNTSSIAQLTSALSTTNNDVAELTLEVSDHYTSITNIASNVDTISETLSATVSTLSETKAATESNTAIISNTTSVINNISEQLSGVGSATTSHISDNTIHITSAERDSWNNKQDTIADIETITSNALSGATAAETIATYGDVVTHNVQEFATADQGAKAETALQSADLVCLTSHFVGEVTEETEFVVPEHNVDCGLVHVFVNGIRTMKFTETSPTVVKLTSQYEDSDTEVIIDVFSLTTSTNNQTTEPEQPEQDQQPETSDSE